MRSRAGSGLPRRRRTGLRLVILVVGVALAVTGDLRFRGDYGSVVIPNRSMATTLIAGDDLLLRSPAPGPPHRGDIVLAAPRTWSNGTPGTEVVQRVIGVAGDMVTCCDDGGRIVVDGRPVTEDYVRRDPTLPAAASPSVPFHAQVPPDSVFLAGDSRANSYDSRSGGSVALSDVRGIAVTGFPLSMPYVSVPATTAFVNAGLSGAPTSDDGYQLDLWLLLVGMVLIAVAVVWVLVNSVRTAFLMRRLR